MTMASPLPSGTLSGVRTSLLSKSSEQKDVVRTACFRR
jgi:hypothetical protein